MKRNKWLLKLALLMFVFIAGGCGGGGGGDDPGNPPIVDPVELPEAVLEIIRLTNLEREKAGLQALRYNDANLMVAAQQRAVEIDSVYAHTRPDGRGLDTIFVEFGIQCNRWGENIHRVPIFRTPSDVVNDWMNSPGHRTNILRREFTHIGVGVYVNDEDNDNPYTLRVNAVQLFIGR